MPAVLAIFLAGWFGGGGPSFLAVALCAAGLDYFFYPPASSLRLEDPYDILRLIVFLGVGSLGSLVFRQLWATRRHRARLVVAAERARASAETAAGELEQIL
jgi:K+-sensing histidine kinase KdpD